MISLIKSLVLVGLLALGGVEASPLVARDCKVKDYGPFRLYAAPTDGSDPEPVKLIDLYTPRPTNDTISVLSVCPDDSCGEQPDYWNLKDMILSPFFNDAQPGYSSVNEPVSKDSTVKFVTSDNKSIAHQLSPIYCAVRNPAGANGLPGFLSVSGSPDNFSMCTNIPTVGPPPRQDIWYKANTTTGLEKFCKPVHLIMQSIGIIAQPIPE